MNKQCLVFSLIYTCTQGIFVRAIWQHVLTLHIKSVFSNCGAGGARTTVGNNWLTFQRKLENYFVKALHSQGSLLLESYTSYQIIYHTPVSQMVVLFNLFRFLCGSFFLKHSITKVCCLICILNWPIINHLVCLLYILCFLLFA